MSALARSHRRLRSFQYAVMTLALVACATAEDPAIEGNGTGNAPAVGGGGTGAGMTSTGGKGGSLPTAGTTSLPTAGTTTTGTGGKPSGGNTGAGGVAPTAGTGTTPTAGTTSTGTCTTPYAGTAAKDSTIFLSGFGQSKMGTWAGYGYTYKYGTATVTPGTGQGCFVAAKFCASGSIPADDGSGAGLGWNISQPQGSSTTMKVPVTTAVKVSFSGLPAGARVQLSASSAVSYCYTLSAADIAAGATGVSIPLASFKTECWDTATAVAYTATTPIEAIQVVVPGAMAAAKTFDFCVLDVEPG